MKKITALVGAIAFCFLPTVSLAANLSSLSGLTTSAQFLATTTATSTMHMKIVSVTDTHTFQWDNTAWRVDQGGTGATSFTNGSLPFLSGGVFAQDAAVGDVLDGVVDARQLPVEDGRDPAPPEDEVADPVVAVAERDAAGGDLVRAQPADALADERHLEQQRLLVEWR